MRASRRFIGVMKNGKEKIFRAGDFITKAEAKTMDLSHKPHLVDKGEQDATENEDTASA